MKRKQSRLLHVTTLHNRPRRPKTALVLMPGGAKGAYQAGALLRLAESGMTFDCVIGSSIGALNGAYYVQGDGSRRHAEYLCDLWQDLPMRIATVLGVTTIERLLDLLQKDGLSLSSLIKDLLSGRQTLLGSRPLATLLDSIIDYHQVVSSRRQLYIGVMEEWGPLFDTVFAPLRHARFLSASSLRPQELKKALIASAAIPILFSAQRVKGIRCRDAGWAFFDLTSIVDDNSIEVLVLIELSQSRIAPVKIATSLPPAVLRISPSCPLQEEWILSTFKFFPTYISKLIELGYRDADETLQRQPALEIPFPLS